jgi:prophage maintenance system killer protein
MILFELFRTESNPVYQALEVENGNRQYDFRSLIPAALAANRVFLSQHVIKMLNFHAIACLHPAAGEYRPCEVTVGSHRPPAYFQLSALMEDFTNEVNRAWDRVDPVSLAAYVYWKINYIHPFINGNGRTARVASYYVLCLRNGGLLEGSPTLPALLKRDKQDCVAALQSAHQAFQNGGEDLHPLHAIFVRLLNEQMASVDEGLPGRTPASP